MQQPKDYGMAMHGCGHSDPEWSEWKEHLWCPVCKVDFIPIHSGLFDGPIGVYACEMMGIVFDRFNLKTDKVEHFDLDKCEWTASAK